MQLFKHTLLMFKLFITLKINYPKTHNIQTKKMSTQSKRKTSKPLPKATTTKKIKTAEKTPSESVTKSINQETKQMSGVCQRLTKAFFEQPSYELAKALLGKILVRKIDGHLLKCSIVETELYPGGDDKGSVSYNDRCTPANEPVFMPAGTMWVYMTYGMYHLINISSGDHGGAVLLRAGEPLEDVDKMHELRLSKLKTKKPLKPQELCSGPAKLCTAMGIDKQTCNAQNVTECNELWFEESDKLEENTQKIVSAKRIGIDRAGAEAVNKLWRFYILDNLHVSKRDKDRENEV